MKTGRKPYIDRSYVDDQYIKKWLVGLSDVTKRNYIMNINQWLDFIQMSPTEQIHQRIQDTVSQDMTQRTFFEDKWRLFKEYLETKNTKASTVQSKLKIVASFFSRNSLPLNLKRGDWETTLTQEVIQKKWVPTNEELRRMYGHANLRDRAMLLVLYQSGLSQIDVANLKIEHLTGILENPDTEHFFFEKPRQKSKHTQGTCFSFEAVHDIKAMLQELGNPTEGYLFTGTSSSKGQQLNARSINDAMKKLAIRTFGEKQVTEKKFETKNLRQAYNSALLRANIQPQELKDVLMGHQRKGARKHYAYDEITIKEAYAKAFKFMTINGIQTKKDLAKLREEFEKNQISNAKTIAKLDTDNQELKNIVTEQQKLIEKMGNKLDKIFELLPEKFGEVKTLTKEESEAEDKELIKLGVAPEDLQLDGTKEPFKKQEES